MNAQLHEQLKSKIWDIANRLRGPYRPPQYRLVMLPIVVLRRLDCVLAPTKDDVLREYEKLQAQGMPDQAMEPLLTKAADPNRRHPLYNTSPYTFQRLLGDSENIAPNLVAYITGFSSTARAIFERFKFEGSQDRHTCAERCRYPRLLRFISTTVREKYRRCGGHSAGMGAGSSTPRRTCARLARPYRETA